ncbi:Hypothetical predicted protein, partial [Paramuricea clavata]
ILYIKNINYRSVLSGLKPLHVTYYGQHDLPISLCIINECLNVLLLPGIKTYAQISSTYKSDNLTYCPLYNKQNMHCSFITWYKDRFRALIKVIISHTVLYIINRKIHGCLEIPDLFLISCSTLEINLVFPRTHILFSIYYINKISTRKKYDIFTCENIICCFNTELRALSYIFHTLAYSNKNNRNNIIAIATYIRRVLLIEMVLAENENDKKKTSEVQPTTSKSISTTSKPVANCSSLYKSGERKDGVYTINPDGLGSFQVRCDMQTDGGGWTMFQRRQDASVDFYRGWQDYKNGFGDLNGNFWLGLDRIHRLTKSGQNVLRVDLTDWNSDTAYAKYGSFSVASESDGYRLDLGSFSGNAGDSLTYHNGMKFSTYDRDNDQKGSNCAVDSQGAWWYKQCHHSNLNGQYLKAGEKSYQGIRWHHWKRDSRSMKKTEIKLRPAGF